MGSGLGEQSQRGTGAIGNGSSQGTVGAERMERGRGLVGWAVLGMERESVGWGGSGYQWSLLRT